MLISHRLGSCKTFTSGSCWENDRNGGQYFRSPAAILLYWITFLLLRCKSFPKMENIVSTFRCGLGETFHLAARVNGQSRSWVYAYFHECVCRLVGTSESFIGHNWIPDERLTLFSRSYFLFTWNSYSTCRHECKELQQTYRLYEVMVY